jgi:PAS domain S-box-containing protein
MDTASKNELKVLILEDEPADAELVERTLREAGLIVVAERVATQRAFVEALEWFKPHIILSDSKLLDFDGFSALKLVREKDLDLPVIGVADFIDDKAAVELIRAGANDYVLKNRLELLPFAVQRAIAETDGRRERKRAEEAIHLGEESFQSAFNAAGHGMALVDLDGRFFKVNAALCRITGYSTNEMLARTFADITYWEDLTESLAASIRMRNGEISNFETEKRYVRKDGEIVWVQLNVSMVHNMAGALVYQIAQVQDITDRMIAASSLKQLNRTLRNVIAVETAVVRATTEQELLNEICRVGVELGGYRQVWVGFIQHDEAKTVLPMAWAGEHSKYIRTVNVSWADNELGRGPTGMAIRTGQVQVIQDVETNPAMAPWLMNLRHENLKSCIALPLKNESEVFGVLRLYADEPDAFGQEEVDLLKEMADNLAFGIRARRDHAGQESMLVALTKLLNSTVQSVATAAEIRDAYTAGHQQRVAAVASAIAHEIGLTASQIEGVFLAGTIHDVGKLSVPAEFLSKPGKLTPLEYQVIQTHVQSGYDIVKGIDFPWPIGQAILQHHERLDGSGYPNRLKGEAISIEGRILAVADVVDAMQSHRPYRPALGLDAALAEIEAGKGRLYDPAVADACIALFRQKGFKFH